MPESEFGESFHPIEKESVASYHKPACSQLGQGCEGWSYAGD
jgi:hypothetical protein